MKALGYLFALSACASGGGGGTSQLSGMPPAAADSLKREAGGAEIVAVEREHEHGTDVFEGAWYIDGRKHEVTVTATGEVVDREEELAPGSVPEPVRTAAKTRWPDATKVVYVKLMSGNFEIENGKQELNVDPAGNALKDDDDEDDEDDDD